MEEIYSERPPSFLVESIVPEGGLVILAGREGSMKSILTLFLVLSVIKGAPFLDKFKVQKTGGVLVVNEENPGSLLKERMKKMKFDKKLPINFCHFAGVRLDTKKYFNRLVKTVEKYSPSYWFWITSEACIKEMKTIHRRCRRS